MYRSHFFLFLLFSVFSFSLQGEEPSILYLTWKKEPSSSMVIIWHQEKESDAQRCYYKKANQHLWSYKDSDVRALSSKGPYVHVAELEGLDADTVYTFYLHHADAALEKKRHFFQTLPSSLSRPLRIVVGGDAFLEESLYRKMNRQVASTNPDCVILGGDLAYTEGLRRAFKTHKWKIERWQEFLRIWTEEMVSSSHRLIPLVPLVGNHDVKEGFDFPLKRPVLFYQLFAFPQKEIAYRVMNIGSELNFYLLDSGHTSPIEGVQTTWLAKELNARKGALYHIPVYHVAAYPTETSYQHRASKSIRSSWIPLFETGGVKISMENDSHTFKRTFCLKGGQIDPTGIYYLGDGCWGVDPLKPDKHWYLEKAMQANNYWQLTIDRSGCRCDAFDIEGGLLDHLDISPLHR